MTMTPSQHKAYVKAEDECKKQLAQKRANEWHVNLGEKLTLRDAKDTMSVFALTQGDVPLIIKLTENPKYFTSKLFTGAVDLFAHDCVHILLGRGVLLKDEAFVIGYTMGSAKKMWRWRRNLFMWICKRLYPEGYKFGEEERFVFYNGVMAGSKCDVDLSTIDFRDRCVLDLELSEIRHLLGIDEELLRCYYCTENRLFKESRESRRLV
jgi:hypothetical protein